MKKFFRALFWRNNPTSGILFGFLLFTLLMAVAMPLWLYLLFLCPENALTEILMDDLEDNRVSIIFFVIAPFLFYHTALSWLYAAHILRRSFRCTKITAGVVACVFGLPPLVPLTLLVCALKKKRVVTLLAFVAAACAVAAAWNAERLPRFIGREGMSQSALLVITAALITAVAAFPSGWRIPKWVCAPLAVMIAHLVWMNAVNTHYERRANQMEEKFLQLAGIPWTEQDALGLYTNGVPKNAEPYATLLSTNIFEGIVQKYRTENFQGRFDPEHLEMFLEFAAANAAPLALLDEITNMPDFRFANEMPTFEPWLPVNYANISTSINWTRYCRWKLAAAEYQNDVPTMLDCLRRMRAIRAGLESLPSFVDGLLAIAVDAFLRAGISMVLPQLPGETLLELRDDITAYRDDTAQRLRMAMANERILFMKTLEYVGSQFMPDMPGMSGVAQFFLKIPHLFSIWMHGERLAYFTGMVENLTFLEKGGMTHESIEARKVASSESRLPLNRAIASAFESVMKAHALLLENSNLALAGIAVEQYRRARGALPESLDALVPKFLDSVPPSTINGEPLMYKRGEFEFPEGVKTPDRFLVNGYMVYGPAYKPRLGIFNSFVVALGPAVRLEPLE